MNIHITKRTAILIAADIISTLLAYLIASWLTGQFGEMFETHAIYFELGILALFNIVIFALFRLYNNLWEYAGTDELIQILIATFLGTLAGAVFLWVIGSWLPIRVYVIACIILVIFLGGTRFGFRVGRNRGRRFFSASSESDAPRTLVVGAGETGSLVIARMISKDPLTPGRPIVATDDDPAKLNLRVHGVKVEGTTDDILSLVEKYDIEQIVVAIPSGTPEERRRIYDVCAHTDCRLRTLPNVRELSMDEIGSVSLRDVEVADLLGRDEIVLNTRAVSGYIAGKTILVTGGGGSIGSELCRQIAKVAPARIVIFDMYENDAYLLRQELMGAYNDLEAIVEIGNVCDKARVHEIFEKYHPSAVFHAAAHKHVPLMEICPREAIQNNVFGTLNVVRACEEFGVDRFTFISTDKAVNPTSVMGATKRMGEMIMQYYAHASKSTIYSAVRFGNVLGSNGSVIPIIKRQIAAGGPVTVTHPDIERYFMTIPEASRLVVQAGGLAKGGEIFILDMGEPVKIVDLAKSLIKLAGLTLGEDIQIEYTGLREGEKMYEELLMNSENTEPTAHKSIMVSKGEEISYEEFCDKLKALEAAISGTDAEAIATLEEAVPTYRYTTNR